MSNMETIRDERLAQLLEGATPDPSEARAALTELHALRQERASLLARAQAAEAALSQARRDLGAWKELAAEYQAETAELSTELRHLRASLYEEDEPPAAPKKKQ